MKRRIWVKTAKKGIHRYPAASTDEKLKDVSYLAYDHRHKFGIKAGIEVFHNDRDVEFHQFLNYIDGLYDNNVLELDYKSCEMIAEDLYRSIVAKYPGRAIEIQIDEDGECGAILSWEANE